MAMQLMVKSPLYGRQIRFTRSLQVKPNSPMTVTIRAKALPATGGANDWAAVAGLMAICILVLVVIPSAFSACTADQVAAAIAPKSDEAGVDPQAAAPESAEAVEEPVAAEPAASEEPEASAESDEPAQSEQSEESGEPGEPDPPEPPEEPDMSDDSKKGDDQ